MPRFGRFIGLTIPAAISIAFLVIVSMAVSWDVRIFTAIVCIPALLIGIHTGRKRRSRP